MPGVVRVGDISQTHGDWPSSTAISGSVKSFSDNKGIMRVGDPWTSHTCP